MARARGVGAMPWPLRCTKAVSKNNLNNLIQTC
jgi:hypothetical protein